MQFVMAVRPFCTDQNAQSRANRLFVAPHRPRKRQVPEVLSDVCTHRCGKGDFWRYDVWTLQDVLLSELHPACSQAIYSSFRPLDDDSDGGTTGDQYRESQPQRRFGSPLRGG